jgi:mannosyltransferase
MDAVAAPLASPGGLRLVWRATPLRLAVAITALALALRLINLGGRPLWLDEAFSAWFSGRSFHYLWTVLPTYEAHPPFYYSLLKLWRSAFGEGASALRALSVMLGTLTIPVVMAAALEQERQRPSGQGPLRSGLAGFLAAASPVLMLIGQEARPYPLLTFGYALAILGLLRLTGEFSSGSPGSWRNWMLLGVSAELTAWSHALGVLYVACLALALLPSWLTSPIGRDRLIRGIATAAGVALVYAPCLLMMASRAQDWSANWLAWHPDMLLQLVVLYTVPIEVLTVGSAVAALAMVLLMKRAIQTAIANGGWNSDRAMLLLWLGPPLLAALISALFVPVFLVRTLAGTLVPACLAIGTGIARTPAVGERRLITLAICATMLPTAAAVALRPATERWDVVSAYLSSHVSSRDEVWLYPSDSALPLSQAGPIPGKVRALPAPFPTLGVKGPIRAGWPAMVSLTPEQAASLADDAALRRAPVVWLVTRQSGIFDPGNDMPKALRRLRSPGPATSWDYITIQPYYARAK